MKVKFEVWSQVTVWELNEVTMEVDTIEEAKAILVESEREWIHHYDTIESKEFNWETIADMNNFEVIEDSLEIISE
jgi:hypothetical protein